jgi:hypothetical protein
MLTRTKVRREGLQGDVTGRALLSRGESSSGALDFRLSTCSSGQPQSSLFALREALAIVGLAPLCELKIKDLRARQDEEQCNVGWDNRAASRSDTCRSRFELLDSDKTHEKLPRYKGPTNL